MRRRRDSRRGQAMVEMALLLPVLMLLFLGSWTAANLIDDNNAAAQATRAGARLGAELGNGASLGLTQNQIGTTPFVPGSCPPNNGAYTAGELIDTYTVSGGVVSSTCGTCTFTLANRSQVHPSEAELGVRLVFKYTSPALTFFTQTDSQYTVMRLAPTA